MKGIIAIAVCTAKISDINNVEEEIIATALARTIRYQRPVKHYSKLRC